MYDHKPFAQWLDELQWRQGEHWLTAAPTQTGKTSITSLILRQSGRKWICVIASKPRDDNMRARYADFKRISKWPPPRDEGTKFLLWPGKQKTLEEDRRHQQVIVKKALDEIGNQGGWCVVVDEFHWLSEFLRLDKEDAVLQHQGASNGITMVNLTQRPAWIPRITYSSATHALIGGTSDPDDLRSLSYLARVDRKDVADTVQRMGRHDLLYLNPMGEAQPCIINSRE